MATIVLVCAAAIEYFRAKRFRYVKTAIPTLATGPWERLSKP